jgi:outer membrane lipoprotein-sorting protein
MNQAGRLNLPVCDQAPSGSYLSRRSTFGLMAAGAVAACMPKPVTTLSGADQAALAEVQTYLNALRQFHARFNQTGDDGEAFGLIWLQRPGRLRVQYVTPRPRLMLANHGRFLVSDGTTGAITTMPVANTPLDILLADQIDLSGEITVSQVLQQTGTVQVGLTKTGNPGQGRLTLRFTTEPMALASVVVQDAAGHTNTLALSGLEQGGTFDPAMFHYLPPKPGA